MARHLHIQAGGDPSQGPVRELANQPPSPGAGNDFPDAPDPSPSDEHDQDPHDEHDQDPHDERDEHDEHDQDPHDERDEHDEHDEHDDRHD